MTHNNQTFDGRLPSRSASRRLRGLARRPAAWIVAGVLLAAGIPGIGMAQQAAAPGSAAPGSAAPGSVAPAGMTHGHRDGGHDHGRGHAGPARGHRSFGSLLKQVNATDEQRAKIRDLTRAARNDLEVLHDREAPMHKAFMDALAKPVIDRTALETLRADRQKLADDISKRRTKEAADLAEVFTPEQRTQLAAKLSAGSAGGHWR